MSAVAAPAAGKMPGMGKKKPAGSDRKTHRVNVGVPEEWHAVMRKLAAKQKQPVLYMLIALVEQEASKQGLADLPVPPWDSTSDE